LQSRSFSSRATSRHQLGRGESSEIITVLPQFPPLAAAVSSLTKVLYCAHLLQQAKNPKEKVSIKNGRKNVQVLMVVMVLCYLQISLGSFRCIGGTRDDSAQNCQPKTLFLGTIWFPGIAFSAVHVCAEFNTVFIINQ
jgi:hypothetical protein